MRRVDKEPGREVRSAFLGVEAQAE